MLRAARARLPDRTRPTFQLRRLRETGPLSPGNRHVQSLPEGFNGGDMWACVFEEAGPGGCGGWG